MYRMALMSQSAPNFQALIRALPKIMDEINAEYKAANPDSKMLSAPTDYSTHHPVVRLFMEQLSFLSGLSLAEMSTGTDYRAASDICEAKAD